MDIYPPTQPTTIQITSHNQYATPGKLSPTAVLPTPVPQFQAWFAAATESGVREPEVMALSTCSLSGVPSTRMVLLKQVDPRGFVFFTNYSSRKSRELSENPQAALCFYWKEVSRSVRVVGKVEKVSAEESDAYYATRPRGSQLGAHASPQSSVVSETQLEENLKELEEKYREGSIPRPEGWGGWRIIPSEVEFWEGKPSRLHDRIRYVAGDNEGEWTIERLGP